MLYINSKFNLAILIFALFTSIHSCAVINGSSSSPVAVATPTVTPKFQQDYNRALSLAQSKKTQAAIRVFQSMTKKYPEFAGPYVNLGLLHFQSKHYSKAMTAFNNALKLNPYNAVSHNHIGIIQRKKGQFKAALKSYRLALTSDPDYANAHLNIGILYDIYLSNLDKALEHYIRYQEITGKNNKEVDKWIIDLKRRSKAS